MIGPAIPVTIRPEAPGDADTIHALTEAAFRDMPYSDGNESAIVDCLRADGDLPLSLVAEDGERIVGHIAFSPVTIADGATGWLGLGPVSVRPDLQGKGIGAALIKRGIADLRVCGTRGIVLVGNRKYYSRFGFEPCPHLRFAGAPPEQFQALLIEGDWPHGDVRYAPAFYA